MDSAVRLFTSVAAISYGAYSLHDLVKTLDGWTMLDIEELWQEKEHAEQSAEAIPTTNIAHHVYFKRAQVAEEEIERFNQWKQQSWITRLWTRPSLGQSLDRMDQAEHQVNKELRHRVYLNRSSYALS